MPRPRKIDRPVEKSISLPESLVARVELELFSELEGRVPHGAWSKYLEGLVREDQLKSTINASRVLSGLQPLT